MQVVNLSLGSLNAAYLERYRETVARASEAGVILVAAVEAQDQPCYPGCLAGTLGVGLDWECDRDTFRIADVNGRAVFYASGYPRPIPGVEPRRNLNGISFAVANMSGFVARAMQGRDALSVSGVVAALRQDQ